MTSRSRSSEQSANVEVQMAERGRIGVFSIPHLPTHRVHGLSSFHPEPQPVDIHTLVSMVLLVASMGGSIVVLFLAVPQVYAGNTTCASSQLDWYSSVVGESPCE